MCRLLFTTSAVQAFTSARVSLYIQVVDKSCAFTRAQHQSLDFKIELLSDCLSVCALLCVVEVWRCLIECSREGSAPSNSGLSTNVQYERDER
jgi:hypothetical protein